MSPPYYVFGNLSVLSIYSEVYSKILDYCNIFYFHYCSRGCGVVISKKLVAYLPKSGHVKKKISKHFKTDLNEKQAGPFVKKRTLRSLCKKI